MVTLNLFMYSSFSPQAIKYAKTARLDIRILVEVVKPMRLTFNVVLYNILVQNTRAAEESLFSTAAIDLSSSLCGNTAE